MIDTKPHRARLGRRRTRKTGDLTDARRKLWQALSVAEEVLLGHDTDATTLLRAVHAITQATTAYAKLIEVGELEARLSELEKQASKEKTGVNGRAYR